jgi:hypothetical protein
MCRVSWNESETHTEWGALCLGNYNMERDGRELYYQSPKTAKCVVKALVAARLPHLVEEAEVLDFLPTAEAQFDDLIFNGFGVFEVLSLLCSLCAQQTDDTELASVYAKIALKTVHPLKQTQAHVALATTQRPQLED